MRKVIMALAGLTGIIVACKSEIELMPNVPVAIGTIDISPAPLSVAKGKTLQLNAVVRDATGNVLPGRSISWSAADPTIATVSATGLLRGMAAGHTNIRASVETKTVEAPADVTLMPVTSVAIAPLSPSVGVGGTVQFSATLRDADGTVLTDRNITWTTSSANVATVSSTGLVAAVGPGTTQITASSETRTASTALTVNPPAPAPVATVTVALNSSSLAPGQTTQATATLRDANGNVLTGRVVSFSSSNTAVASVSSSGVVTAIAAGTANITATSESRSGSAALTVTAPTAAPVATVAVSLAASTRTVGQTTQATATLRDASNNILTGRTIAWSSSNTGVATVTAAGVVTAVSAGSANITATSEGQSGFASLTVSAPAPAPVATVAVSVTSPLVVGSSAQAQVTLRDAANNVLTGRVVSWSSSNTAVATVSGSGLVNAASAGSANIIATSEGRTGQAALTVNAPTPPPPTGTGEPVYDAATQSLLVRDNFDQYTSIGAALNAYPNNRGTEDMELTTGRGGSGNAARLKYGIGGAYDIVFGTEGRLSRVGGWNGTLPQKAGPYTHFFFTTWFRFSAGADPAANNGSGVKGFMFWTGSGRYQNAINQISADGRTRGPKAANPNNAESGQNLYKTSDGRAPLFSTLADGQWHRFTIEIYAGGDPSGHFGERYWIDGNLIYSDVDIRVGTGTAADHYDYAQPITHFMVFGNFVSEGARSPFFTFDVDDWMAWTP